MNSKFWALTITALGLLGVLCYWVVVSTPKIVTPEEILLRKVDSLSAKIDSINRLNDSIKTIIDTTEIEIQHTYERYIEIRDRIIEQSVDSDCIFFSDYLSKDSQRFVDTINFEPVKAY